MMQYTELERNSARHRASLSAREATHLLERPLYCPECSFKIGVAYSDCAGHVRTKCQKCKTVSILMVGVLLTSRRAAAIRAAKIRLLQKAGLRCGDEETSS